MMRTLYSIFFLSVLILSQLSFANQKQDAMSPLINEEQDLVDSPPDKDEFSAIYINQGMFNGEDWIKLSDRDKETYVLAYQDGFTANAIFYIKDRKQRKEAIASFPVAQLDKLVSEIDKIYADKRNINFPVPYALVIVRNKLKGTNQKKIDAYIKYLRKEIGGDKANGQ